MSRPRTRLPLRVLHVLTPPGGLHHLLLLLPDVGLQRGLAVAAVPRVVDDGGVPATQDTQRVTRMLIEQRARSHTPPRFPSRVLAHSLPQLGRMKTASKENKVKPHSNNSLPPTSATAYHTTRQAMTMDAAPADTWALLLWLLGSLFHTCLSFLLSPSELNFYGCSLPTQQ